MRVPLMSVSRRVSPPAIQAAASGASGPADNMRGAAYMIAAMTFFSVNDAIMKLVMQGLPLYQSIAMRGIVSASLLLMLVTFGPEVTRIKGPIGMSGRDYMILTIRIIAEVGAAVLYMTALRHMALGDIGAILQTTPLFIILGAALFLGERIGLQRIGAIAVGVIGMLIILRPGTPSFDSWALLALASVMLVVLRDIITRTFSSNVPPGLIALSSSLGVMGFGLVMSFGAEWIMPSIRDLVLMGVAATLLSGGYVFSILTIRTGEVSFVAPFRYWSLIVAIGLGYLLFGELPDRWTAIGAMLVVGAGLFVIWREARLRRDA